MMSGLFLLVKQNIDGASDQVDNSRVANLCRYGLNTYDAC